MPFQMMRTFNTLIKWRGYAWCTSSEWWPSLGNLGFFYLIFQPHTYMDPPKLNLTCLYFHQEERGIVGYKKKAATCSKNKIFLLCVTFLYERGCLLIFVPPQDKTCMAKTGQPETSPHPIDLTSHSGVQCTPLFLSSTSWQEDSDP